MGDEFTVQRLPETTWHLQVLRLFGTLTGRSAPWLNAKPRGKGEKERSAHPNSWNLASWHDELRQMRFGRALLRAFKVALVPDRARVRRPQWTATLVSLLRTIWRNILTAPSSGRVPHHVPISTIIETYGKEDVLILDLVEGGMHEFLAYCIGGIMDSPISSVNVVASDGSAEPLHTLRSAGVALLEDIVSAGCKHGTLVDAVAGLVNRRFIDEQVRLLHSHIPGLRESTARLLRVLLDLGVPQLDNLVQQAAFGLPGILEAAIGRKQSGGSDQVSGGSSAPARRHPLELHRFQVGELTGGFKTVQQAELPLPAAVTAPTVALQKAKPGPTQPRLRTEVVVQPKRQSSGLSRR